MRNCGDGNKWAVFVGQSGERPGGGEDAHWTGMGREMEQKSKPRQRSSDAGWVVEWRDPESPEQGRAVRKEGVL